MASEEIYFKCPNCPATYNFEEFHRLEHRSRTSPADGPGVLGHAKCGNCTKDFYYYFTSDAYPVVVENEPNTVVLLQALHQSSADKLAKQQSATKAAPKSPVGIAVDLKKSDREKMNQFENALNAIDKKLPPLELYPKL